MFTATDSGNLTATHIIFQIWFNFDILVLFGKILPTEIHNPLHIKDLSKPFICNRKEDKIKGSFIKALKWVISKFCFVGVGRKSVYATCSFTYFATQRATDHNEITLNNCFRNIIYKQNKQQK